MKPPEIIIDPVVGNLVEPFARLMSGPGCVLPTQDAYARLQHFYDANDHPDFHHPFGYVPWQTDVDIHTPMQLPFSLALGLHDSIRQIPDIEATRQTFAVYAAQRTLVIVEGGEPMERRVRRDRAAAVISAAILRVAITPLRGPRTAPVDEAISLSRDEGLLSRSEARLLSRTARQVHVHP